MKTTYYHYRIPEHWFNAMYEQGLRTGQPPINTISYYNRKRQRFLNPYENMYKPYPRGGMTEARIYDPLSGMTFVGRSWCSLSDGFSYSTGRIIAYQRAYSEFLTHVPY